MDEKDARIGRRFLEWTDEHGDEWCVAVDALDSRMYEWLRTRPSVTEVSDGQSSPNGSYPQKEGK